MTVTNTVNKLTYSANGVTTAWPFAFRIPTADDVQVIVADADGVESVVSSSAYSISGLNDPAGGTVTYPLSGDPLASGNTLTVRRVVAITQSTDLVTGAAFYADVHEDVFDRAAMIDQQQQEVLDRTLKFPVSDGALTVTLPVAANRANRAVKFDANGNATVSTYDPDSQVANAAAQAAAAAASASAAETAKTAAETAQAAAETAASDAATAVSATLSGYVSDAETARDAAQAAEAGAQTAQTAAEDAAAAAAASASSVGDPLEKAANLSDLTDAAAARSNLGLAAVAASGAYAELSGTPPIGTDTGDLIALENVGGVPGLPPVDGSQLINLPATGAMVFVSEASLVGTSAASVEFTGIEPGYDYFLSFKGLSAGAGYNLLLMFKDAGGFLGGNYMWSRTSYIGASQVAENSNYSSGAYGKLVYHWNLFWSSGEIAMPLLGDSTKHPTALFRAQIARYDGTNINGGPVWGAVEYDGYPTVTSIVLQSDGSNLSHGKIALYRIKRSA
jgi:hypothetical protein